MSDMTLARRRWLAGSGLAALVAGSLAGCATPTYPTDLSGTKAANPPAAAPPATSPPAETAAPVETSPPQNPSAELPPPVTAARPPASVESAPLPPLPGAPGGSAPPPAGPNTGALVVGAPPSPAQSALPPSYTPPPASAPVEIPPPTGIGGAATATQSASPPLSASPPPAPPPRTPSRPAPSAQAYVPPPPPTIRYHQVPGRVIAGGKVVAATGMYRDYLVQPRDHLDAIARDLGTTRRVLVEANHLKLPYALRPGEHIKVPVAKAYQAAGGDTLADVAKRFSISPAALADLNDLPEKAKLRAGDRVALPDRFEDRGPTRLAAATTVEHIAAPNAVRPTYRAPARPANATASASSYAQYGYGQPRADGGPYVPSPAALAAARRLSVTRSYGPPSYGPGGPGGPGPGGQIASRTYGSPGYGSPAYRPPAYQPPPYQGADFGGRSPSAIAALARGRFIWPVRGAILAPFGVQGLGRRNDGIDIRSPAGSPVRVAAAGEVVYAGNEVPGFGNLVLVKHLDGWVTAYAHLASIGVQMRQSVAQGQMLGDVGATGSVNGPQLHFEVRYAASPMDKPRPVDPLLVLPK